jgi:transposase
MPWKESSAVEERLRVVARLIEGEAMTDLCLEFGISRRTGYKIFNRCKEEGLAALQDRSRRPVHDANPLPAQIEALIVRLKGEKHHWRARKIREWLGRRLPGEVRLPAISTVLCVRDRHGLVARIGRRRQRAQGAPLSESKGGPTTSGARISRAHSHWATAANAIRSPSPTRPAASS